MRTTLTAQSETEQLRKKLEEANATLDAIRNGEVDAIVVQGEAGEKVYTLSSAEEPYRLMVEEITEGAVTISADHLIVYCNKAFAYLIGRPIEQITASQFEDYIVPAQRQRFLSLIAQVNHKHIRGEFSLVSEKGTTEVLISSTPWLVQTQAISMLVTNLSERKTIEDVLRSANDHLEDRISERTAELVETNQQLYAEIQRRTKAEQEVRRLNTDLEERIAKRTEELTLVNKELEAFSYSISHDLRAPLRAINSFANILAEENSPQLSEKGSHYLDVIRINAIRLGQLVDDLLAFSRLNKRSIDKTLINMRLLAESTVDELKQMEPAHRVLEVSIGDLPPAHGEAAMIRQVMVNLISNALKFSRPSAVTKITISGREEGDEVIYSISDNGVGFDMTYVDKLFGVFQRLHRDEEFEGSGVGLAFTQRIILRHGGRVWAEGDPQLGATFSFALPKS